MADKTKIEWCDATFNPWIGCQKVSPGCDHCYAEGWAKRSGLVEWGPHSYRRRTSEANWRKPLQWAKAARGAARRPRVFCASLSDVFDNRVPTQWRRDLFILIRTTPELDWLLLTKRPENARWMLPDLGVIQNPEPNVWLGFTAENQEHFDHRWQIMREIPAVVRFCSYEPAIGPLRLWKGFNEKTQSIGYEYVQGLDWLICGGESGHGYRQMDIGWAEDVRLDCARAGVSFFLKQLAGKKPIPDWFPLVRQFPKAKTPCKS